MSYGRQSAVARVVDAPDLESGREPTLLIDGLSVDLSTADGTIRVVDSVGWSVEQGRITALVGESGCGKSVTALAVMRLLRANGRISGGRICFNGQDLSKLSSEEMRKLRGRDIAMVFQEPMTSLNPVLTIGLQITETLVENLGLSKAEADEKAIELLDEVGIPDPRRRLSQYPYELSGGMRQRVVIAIALACRPQLIIADEPTTALDVTIQAQILELLAELARRRNMALVIITHNMGIVARYADSVNVMYAGKIVESGPAEEVFSAPKHPYTELLLRSVLRLDQPRQERLATIPGALPNLLDLPSGCRFAPRCPARLPICDQKVPELENAGNDVLSACHRKHEPLAELLSSRAEARVRPAVPISDTPVLEVSDLKKHFKVSNKGTLRAVDGVSFQVSRNRTLGLVGESGCGKTTVGRMIVGLEQPTAGSIKLNGTDRSAMSRQEMKVARRGTQIVFQDPYSSLNPRMTVAQSIAEPLRIHGMVKGKKAIQERAEDLLNQVGLPSNVATRYPHQLSGGQRQRVGIARALTVEPDFLLLDEPVSALDISVQGKLITLLEDLRDKFGLSSVFIAHDLAVVRHISDDVAIMYFGRIVEKAPRDELYARPLHPYTRALLDAAPTPDPKIERSKDHKPLSGELPSPLSPPTGCPFRSRCALASSECGERLPPLRDVYEGHSVACIKV